MKPLRFWTPRDLILRHRSYGWMKSELGVARADLDDLKRTASSLLAALDELEATGNHADEFWDAVDDFREAWARS